MQTQTDKIAIGRDIVKKINQKVVSSHAIISKTELPFLMSDELGRYQEKFGVHRMLAYMEHQAKTNHIRNIVSQVASNALSIAALTITEFGVGECHEQATLALYHLLKDGHQGMAILMMSTPVNRLTKDFYGHVFVLFGVTEQMLPQAGSDISCLNQLPDDVVVIDPFLNCVLPANQYIANQAEYIDCYGYKQIVSPTYYDAMSSHMIAQQDLQVEHVKIRCLRAGLKPYLRDEQFYNLTQFDPATLEPCEDTLLMRCLKQRAELAFQFGHSNYHLHAFAEIKTPEDEAKAQVMQKKLKAGYIHQQSQQSFFVLHHINHKGALSDSLWQHYGNK